MSEKKKPDWWKYEQHSDRVYLAVERLAYDAPLLSNYPGESFDSMDDEPQRLAPLYLDFDTGEVFYYEQEAKDLGADKA